MNHLRTISIVLALSLASLLHPACFGARAVPASVTTPQGQVAYQSEDALDAIGVIQHAAINARRSNLIDTPTMRVVVKATIGSARVINVAIDNGTGLAAAYKDARSILAEAQKELPPATAQKFQVEFGAADAILVALAPVGGK